MAEVEELKRQIEILELKKKVLELEIEIKKLEYSNAPTIQYIPYPQYEPNFPTWRYTEGGHALPVPC